MAGYSLIAAIVIRFFMCLTPFVGVLHRDAKHFALRGPALYESLELMGVVNTRLILLSWPLFAVVTLATRANELSKTFAGAGVPIIVAIVIAVEMLFFLLPCRLFRGIIPPIVATVFVSVIDAGFYFLALDRLLAALTV